MTAPPVRWLTIYLDTPEGSSSRRFWCAATGYALSEPRGERAEFATLLPPEGDAHVRVQVTGADVAAAHLDLHVDDLDAAVAHATAVAAELVARSGHAWLRSPGGCDLCLVPHQGERLATPPAVWPDGHRSRLDQLTVDVAHDDWADEQRFWSDLTAWPVGATARPDLARLHTPPELPGARAAAEPCLRAHHRPRRPGDRRPARRGRPARGAGCSRGRPGAVLDRGRRARRGPGLRHRPTPGHRPAGLTRPDAPLLGSPAYDVL